MLRATGKVPQSRLAPTQTPLPALESEPSGHAPPPSSATAVYVEVTVHVSWLRYPDKLPLPYWMAKAVPFFTYVLDLAPLYLW